MNNIQKAIELAVAALKERYGEDANIQQGDTVACLMNDCILVITNVGHIDVNIITGEPLKVDFTLFESEDKTNE